MLVDPRAIAIMRSARQKGLRNPQRSRQVFENIFADFFAGISWAGTCAFDLGPGQWDFGRMVRPLSCAVAGADKDDAVCALAKYLGFSCYPLNFQNAGALRGVKDTFDGLFCKFSINALWFPDDAAQMTFVDDVAGLLKPGGWAWIGPWNGKRDNPNVDAAHILGVQAERFRHHGFRAFDLTEALSVRYGIHGDTANRALFTRNLPVPDAVALREMEEG